MGCPDLSSLAAVLALTIGSAQAQTAKSPGTDSKPLLENERMRVIEMLFKPGSKTSILSHPSRFVYALTDGSLVFSPPGKTPYELSFKAGEALWLPAEAMVTRTTVTRRSAPWWSNSRKVRGPPRWRQKAGQGQAQSQRRNRPGGRRQSQGQEAGRQARLNAEQE